MVKLQTKLVSTDDAARLLGVARSTVTRWAQSGKLTPVMQTSGIRGAYIFDATEVERVAEERAA